MLFMFNERATKCNKCGPLIHQNLSILWQKRSIKARETWNEECVVRFGVNFDGGGGREGGPALITHYRLHTWPPQQSPPFTALRAIYTAYLERSFCLCDSLCQPLFRCFFTTDPALWILTVWSLLPHKQTLRTLYLRSLAPLHSAPGLLCPTTAMGIQTLVVSNQPVREKCSFHCFLWHHLWGVWFVSHMRL